VQVGAGIEPWVLAGLALGAVAAVLVAGAFVAGERLFPEPRPDSDRSSSGIEERRRAEIRYYLTAIDEAYEEDADVGAFTVAFFLPERDVAITFDAHAYLSLREGDVHAVLCEHEMPGTSIGERLPFETPTIDGEDDPADGDRSNRPGAEERGQGRGTGHAGAGRVRDRAPASFAVLGLPATASEREVREAYRKRVKETHPDHGGDEESFRRLREAYEVAREHAD